MSVIELGRLHQVMADCKAQPKNISKSGQAIDINRKFEGLLLQADLVQNEGDNLVKVVIGLADIEGSIQALKRLGIVGP